MNLIGPPEHSGRFDNSVREFRTSYFAFVSIQMKLPEPEPVTVTRSCSFRVRFLERSAGAGRDVTCDLSVTQDTDGETVATVWVWKYLSDSAGSPLLHLVAVALQIPCNSVVALDRRFMMMVWVLGRLGDKGHITLRFCISI